MTSFQQPGNTAAWSANKVTEIRIMVSSCPVWKHGMGLNRPARQRVVNDKYSSPADF
jgi:hypothetical protein